jgi:exonuclease VII small subunit
LNLEIREQEVARLEASNADLNEAIASLRQQVQTAERLNGALQKAVDDLDASLKRRNKSLRKALKKIGELEAIIKKLRPAPKPPVPKSTRKAGGSSNGLVSPWYKSVP